MTPRRRPPASVVKLGLISLGFYFAWYYFIAFRELDFRFGRRHSGLIFLGLLPLVGPFFLIGYTVKELRNLRSDRAAHGLSPGLGGWEHTGLVVIGLLPAITAYILLGFLTASPWWILAPIVLALLSPLPAVPALARGMDELWAAAGSSEAEERVPALPQARAR